MSTTLSLLFGLLVAIVILATLATRLNIPYAILLVIGGLVLITIVVLQLVSSQYTPRALRGFLQDRVTQTVAGGFFRNFCLFVACTCRDPRPDPCQSRFLPHAQCHSGPRPWLPGIGTSPDLRSPYRPGDSGRRDCCAYCCTDTAGS